jgi:phosphatidylglycerophosphatase A
MTVSSTPLSPMSYLATLGPVGHISMAPGTVGSALAVVFGYYIAGYGTVVMLALTVLVFIIGVFASNSYIEAPGRKDPPEVIIDEVAGQWLALILLPHEVVWYVIGFVLFRFFDILKPGPVKAVEAFNGGIGVMADDLVAGLLTGICLWATSQLL